MAVLLPVGIISAWLVIPPAAKDKLLQPASARALPVILKAYPSRVGFEFNIRTNTDTTQFQLEWVNNQTLTYPTATIYQTQLNDGNVQHGRLVGRIEARGSYYFMVDSTFKPSYNSTYQLVLYDFIHQKNMDIIKL
ncbi:MAG TPA: hypothetical protein PLP23_17760 [Panacibacter sp.]|nr:hypothetical protein [Panacibacter sp.]